MQREEDSRENEEWEFLQTCLNALNTQKAGIEQQADAIRKRLGIPKKR